MEEGKLSENEINEIVRDFSIDIKATQRVAFSNQDIMPEIKVFRVVPENIQNPLYKDINFPTDVYILHLPDIVEISCFSHLVGEELDKKCLKIGEVCAKVIQELWPFEEENTLYYDILRAAPGYRIWEGFQKLGKELKKIRIRPHYKIVSYRRHNPNSSQLVTLFKDYSSLPRNKELTIIKPDTEASGKTSSFAVGQLIKEATKRKNRVKEMIITGYISAPSLDILQKLANQYNFKIKILAWGNITALYSNNYDMPIYGLDEAAWREKGELRKLGSIIPAEIFKDYLMYFPPGADQPGDWSARQSFVDTGLKMEPGEIQKHLKNSLKFINNLYQLSKTQSWYKAWHEEIFQNELKALKETLLWNNQKTLL